MRRSVRVLVVVAIGAALVVDARPATAARSKKCPSPPVTLRLEASGDVPVGGRRFRVSDGVARRVAILPEATADFTDQKARARLERRAGRTALALYSVYLADFEVPRRELTGPTFGDVQPTGKGTIATLTIVPPSKRGFAAGDVVTGRDLTYETTTTFAPVGLTVRSAANADELLSYSDVVGEVTIVELERARLCVDIDLEFRRDGQVVTAARGMVSVPVVRAPNSFYFT